MCFTIESARDANERICTQPPAHSYRWILIPKWDNGTYSTVGIVKLCLGIRKKRITPYSPPPYNNTVSIIILIVKFVFVIICAMCGALSHLPCQIIVVRLQIYKNKKTSQQTSAYYTHSTVWSELFFVDCELLNNNMPERNAHAAHRTRVSTLLFTVSAPTACNTQYMRILIESIELDVLVLDMHTNIQAAPVQIISRKQRIQLWIYIEKNAYAQHGQQEKTNKN